VLLSKNEYTQKSILLNNSTIGAHTRHVIELFQCLFVGYENGIVNYEHRKRDVEIENENNYAISLIQDIIGNLDKENKTLLLEGFFVENDNEILKVETNYFRELIYNLEHTIHHMALLRIGITEVSNVQIPENFGVAPSTMLYRNLCVQ
ncbi:MAG: hypothetical protein ABL929_13065, partial [Ferruginibacter sp.]